MWLSASFPGFYACPAAHTADGGRCPTGARPPLSLQAGWSSKAPRGRSRRPVRSSASRTFPALCRPGRRTEAACPAPAHIAHTQAAVPVQTRLKESSSPENLPFHTLALALGLPGNHYAQQRRQQGNAATGFQCVSSRGPASLPGASLPCLRTACLRLGFRCRHRLCRAAGLQRRLHQAPHFEEEGKLHSQLLEAVKAAALAAGRPGAKRGEAVVMPEGACSSDSRLGGR